MSGSDLSFQADGFQAQPTPVELGERGLMPSEKQYKGDAGYDLYVSEETSIAPGEFKDVPTGIKIALPNGYWGMITGRSSTIRKLGLHVPIGIIDNGWRGELFVGAWNLNTGNYRKDARLINLQPGERIGQLILFPVIHTSFIQVNKVPPSDRGENGFGSTGK